MDQGALKITLLVQHLGAQWRASAIARLKSEPLMSYISSISRAWDYSLIDLVVYLADILTYEPDCVHDVTLLCTTMCSVFFEPVEEVESNFHTFHSVGELCRLQH